MKVYGKNTCLEILKNGKNIKKVYLQKTVDEEFKNKVTNLYKNVFIVDKDYLNKITNFKNHQGIVIEIGEFSFSSLEEIIDVHNQKNTRAFIVVLDNIEDPQNLGSLIRTCVCADVDGLIIPKNHGAGISETVYKV